VDITGHEPLKNLMDNQPLLQVGDAVAAILRDENGRYLLQLRDDLPHIWYPGHWGAFGGSVEAGEDELAALHRELEEELEFRFSGARKIVRFDFDMRPLGLKSYFRSYYEIAVDAAQARSLVLHEGEQMRWFSGAGALSLKLVPYDAFALFLHNQQKRLSG
jgi:8-oxo-dGTP pyrophosphatase MutT (NUDIX family)